MGKISSSKDLLMLLLYVEGETGEICEPIFGKTRLMKMVFLFGKELRRRFNLGKAISKSIMPSFEAHDFGPFAKDVYRDLDFLQELGFVRGSRNDQEEVEEAELVETSYWDGLGYEDDQDSPFLPNRFELTEVGRHFVEDELLDALTDEQVEALQEFKARCTTVKLSTLLRYVYSKYPEYATASKIKDRVLGQ